ncbi:hypothetical protein DN407_15595 [Bacillus sp. JAS24-2]|nr:hypothetical protein DN407_15595 [Bacillus sp. JAS24-2]
MPTFIKSIKDNKKLYKKTTFCLKISLKLMDVGWDPKQYDFISKTTILLHTFYLSHTLIC